MDAIIIVYNYIKQNLFEPSCNWSDFNFKKRSYERWAACEILDRIMKTEKHEPFYIILYFIYQMDKFSKIHEDSDSGFMFKTARDIGEKIISLF